MNKDIEEILLSHDQIVTRCQELGQIITKEYTNKTPILIGLLKGCIPFMAELMKYIDCPMEMDFFDVSSYDGTKSTGNIRILKDIDTEVLNRDVILIEDIIDTGLTLQKVTQLLAHRGANSIEIATLLDKKEGRTVFGINPKYVGFDIPNKFVVGFGLDYNEIYRNLPYIGVLKHTVYEK